MGDKYSPALTINEGANLAICALIAEILYLAGVHGSRTHPGRSYRPASVLKTERPTGTHPLPRLTAVSQALLYDDRTWSMTFFRSLLGRKPMIWPTGWPPLNTRRVGMARMP
jgi:hypothetical protein